MNFLYDIVKPFSEIYLDQSTMLVCSSSLKEGLYKPSFAGFVDVDLADQRLRLRSLVCCLISTN